MGAMVLRNGLGLRFFLGILQWWFSGLSVIRMSMKMLDNDANERKQKHKNRIIGTGAWFIHFLSLPSLMLVLGDCHILF